MEARNIDNYEQEIKTILASNPATPADLNTALLAFDASLANQRMKTALKNVTLTVLLNSTDSTLVHDAIGLLP